MPSWQFGGVGVGIGEEFAVPQSDSGADIGAAGSAWSAVSTNCDLGPGAHPSGYPQSIECAWTQAISARCRPEEEGRA